MNGIIVIDKPQGMTSHDVVSFLRRKTGIKRIGHSGTLDPMATGVLPVFIGKATRMIEYAGIPGDPEAKIYRCVMRLGIETDTQDIWGNIISEFKGDLPEFDEIEGCLKGFVGSGTQRPPLYSAVRVAGRKLYEYARKGACVDADLIKERNIYIKHITVKHADNETGEIVFDVGCSRGVYIRTLCADAGRLLGCGAVMSGLTRLKSDGFSLENAIPLDDLRCDNVQIPDLLPMDMPLMWMPQLVLSEISACAFVQGRVTEYHNLDAGTFVRAYGREGFLGVGEMLEKGILKPKKVLASPD